MNATLPIRTNMDFTFMWGTYVYTSWCSGTYRRVCMYICIFVGLIRKIVFANPEDARKFGEVGSHSSTYGRV